MASSGDKSYSPQAITVKIGINNTVLWVNEDTIPHGIPTPDNDRVDRAFFNAIIEEKTKQPYILPGESFQYTFTKPGTIDYLMEPHPWMTGTVTVLPPLP